MNSHDSNASDNNGSSRVSSDFLHICRFVQSSAFESEDAQVVWCLTYPIIEKPSDAYQDDLHRALVLACNHPNTTSEFMNWLLLSGAQPDQFDEKGIKLWRVVATRDARNITRLEWSLGRTFLPALIFGQKWYRDAGTKSMEYVYSLYLRSMQTMHDEGYEAFLVECTNDLATHLQATARTLLGKK